MSPVLSKPMTGVNESDNVPYDGNILCLAPNPSLQITIQFDGISIGEVNRGICQTNSLGGKGQNLATAIKQYYGNPDRVTLLQILGGSIGNQIQAMEDEVGYKCATVWNTLPTRTSITCLNIQTGEMTEMVGVSGTIDKSVELEYEQRAIELLQKQTPRALALCGTFPPGLHATTMANIIKARVAQKTLVFVDAVKDIQPVLATGCINILKINSIEVVSILAEVDSAYQNHQPRDIDLAKAAAAVGTLYNIDIVAVTDGPSTAYLADRKQNMCYGFSIPDLLKQYAHFIGETKQSEIKEKTEHQLLNPLGAGDTCSAIMLSFLLDGIPAVEAFAQGLAAASASCLMSTTNSKFDHNAMERIRKQIFITEH
ncbi:Ribokinase-like protein [Coemansia reversa NRRL 1564]|uniref:Ribokinase-like protein n=1 Tax=Coemansia reversa (strain ATCC 12441 / NRRL 1564) TaxID=763665 RepID=A0A2G5BL60_COERN|nr:Ribokinase-like protein [Coemansia reversa NRRL 1564]|eukprot:PIA19702.1 Ribokinase-like protein [Coemansia reversa NRRL 1564]